MLLRERNSTIPRRSVCLLPQALGPLVHSKRGPCLQGPGQERAPRARCDCGSKAHLEACSSNSLVTHRSRCSVRPQVPEDNHPSFSCLRCIWENGYCRKTNKPVGIEAPQASDSLEPDPVASWLSGEELHSGLCAYSRSSAP